MSVCSVHVHSISIYYLRLLLILFITWQQNERKTRWYTFWTFSIALPPFSDDTIEFKLDIVYHRAHRFFFFAKLFCTSFRQKEKENNILSRRLEPLFSALKSQFPLWGLVKLPLWRRLRIRFFFFFCCCLLIRMGNRHSLDNLSGD